MTALLISDLHLSEARPDLTAAFERFLQQHALQATELFILGDLFEVWVGDDHQTPLSKKVTGLIHDVVDAGIAVFVMHGNRDFMLDKRFERESGAKLIADPSVLELYGHELVLSHGDSYCTDDLEYQKTKRLIRNPFSLSLLKALPRSARMKIAGNLRAKSDAKKQVTASNIMDVNESAIADAFEQYDVHTMIHGHTHRPARHQDGSRERIVLGDWGETLWYVTIDTDGIKLTEAAI